MKIDARLVKQSVGMIVGGVIFAWSAMDKGRIDGIKEGKRLQAGWTVRAIEDAYEKEKADDIINRVNAKFNEYVNESNSKAGAVEKSAAPVFRLNAKNLLALWSEDHEQRRILCEKTNFGTIRLRLAT